MIEKLRDLPPASSNEKEFLSSKEAADFLCITITTLNKYSSAGKLPFYKPDGEKYRVYMKSELKKWIETGRRGTILEVYQGIANFKYQKTSKEWQNEKLPASKEYFMFLAVTNGKKQLEKWHDPIPERN
jgi:excisionase family DNA binding protein